MGRMLFSVLPPSPMQAIAVKVDGGPGAYRLTRGGRPYFVKGVGGGKEHALLAKMGGNSMRSWGLETAIDDLENCRRAKLTLTMGIWLPHKNENPNWADPALLESLKKRVRDAVAIGKDHPNLLAYGLGNEMEWGGLDSDVAMWTAYGELAKLLKSLDPNHPIVCVVAELSPEKIKSIQQYAPDVDILGVNSYGGAASLPARLKATGWTKPYLITEFGPVGPWEGGKTPWGAAIEATSTEKSARYASSYQGGILGGKGDCLGSYAFLWGAKQEETATWFGMFLPGSSELVEPAETMSALWRGKALPKGRLDRFFLPKEEYAPGEAMLPIVVPADGRAFALNFEIRGETPVKGAMGAGEATLPVLSRASTLSAAGTQSIPMTAPETAGAYRIYVVARDGSGYAATANVAFRVR